MAADARQEFGWRVYALGIVHLAIVGLVLKDFLPGQPVPKAFPERAALALAANIFLLAAGAAMEWRRIAAWAAAALTAYQGLFVVLLMDGRLIARNADKYVAYGNTAEQLAIAAGALIAFALLADLPPARAQRLLRIGRIAFGLCALVFGGSHFVYVGFTAPLVPKWLPLSGEVWAYATGAAHIAGGLAILTGVRARLAAILLTTMYGLFIPLVHLPVLAGDPGKLDVWAENATTLALAGVAWIVADSLGRRSEPA